jgi:uncharacterized protein (DUF2252 family)
VPPSPLGWVCGDAHLENVGSYVTADGGIGFDLNDFDECARLPLAVDLVRFLSSIAVTTLGFGMADADRTELMRVALLRYGAVLATGKALMISRDLAKGEVKTLFKQVESHPIDQLISERTVATPEGPRLRLDNKRQLPLRGGRAARLRVAAALAPMGLTVIDAAARLAGVGSTGRPRLVALVRDRSGALDLLDIKSSWPSSAAQSFRRFRQPRFGSDAERIVQVQRWLLAREPLGLGTIRVGRRTMVMRELQPQEDRLDHTALRDHPKRLVNAIDQSITVLAYAHLRGAGRAGAASAQELEAFGASLDAAAWINAAQGVAGQLLSAHTAVAAAWQAGDPALHGLCAPRPKN